MREAITISLPKDIKKELDKAMKEEGVSRSDIVRESLRNYLFIRRYRRLRDRGLGKAEARGIYGEEDVFERVS